MGSECIISNNYPTMAWRRRKHNLECKFSFITWSLNFLFLLKNIWIVCRPLGSDEFLLLLISFIDVYFFFKKFQEFIYVMKCAPEDEEHGSTRIAFNIFIKSIDHIFPSNFLSNSSIFMSYQLPVHKGPQISIKRVG